MKNKVYFPIIILLCLCISSLQAQQPNKKIVSLSRASAVKIVAGETSLGTGFFIRDSLIVSCFHVIARITISAGNVNYEVHPNLFAVNEYGEKVQVDCISMPTNPSPEPYYNDFAVLKVREKMEHKKVLELSQETIDITDPVIFSGYPLGLQTLITHTGQVSGRVADSIVYVQAPVNNGSSGSALLNSKGEVIGIVTFKLAGSGSVLENQLAQLHQIQQTFGKGALMTNVIVKDGTTTGFDQIEFAREITANLYNFLETGIGGANHVSFLREYLRKKNL